MISKVSLLRLIDEKEDKFDFKSCCELTTCVNNKKKQKNRF